MGKTEKLNLANVTRSERRGILTATSFNVGFCENCDSCHFELQDREGKEFAVALIPPEHFRGIAAWFFQAAAEIEERNGGAGKGLQS